MTYYYPTGTVLPPPPAAAQAVPMLNEKPGLYGAYNGGVPVTVASRPVMSTGIQYIQAPGIVPGGLPPGSQMQVMPQPRPPGPSAPPAGFAVQTASPYPVSSAATAGYCTSLQQSPYIASAGLYQGASLAYPQPNISPAAPPTVSGSPYGIGRSVSPYAGTQPMANLSNTTYPGTVIGGMMPAVGFPPASVAPPAQQPTYTISTQEVGIMPTPPQHMRAGPPPQVGAAGAHTAIPAAQAAAYPQHTPAAHGPPAPGGLQSYPPGAIIASSPAGMPAISPAMGAPLVANPNFPGASPYQRAMP